MQYINSPSNDAYFNMALEEYVFEQLSQHDDFFMLWQNKNAIVVGKYQNTAEEINQEYVSQNDISVVRRLSGGGAMYQDMGNLNFTFVVPQNTAKSLDFGIFIQPVIHALKQVGITAEFNSRNDITIEGKKFSGNSQYNKHGRTMHHGTLLFCSNLSVVGSALKAKPEKIQSKGVKSVRSRVTNICDYLPEALTVAQFKQILLTHMFASDNKTTPYSLTSQDLAGVEKLKTEKYATWEWNYGASPQYNLHRRQTFPFGSVSAWVELTNETIQSARFSGDFFGNGDIGTIEHALQGQPMREDALLQALQSVNVGHYIHGMQAHALVALLLGSAE